MRICQPPKRLTKQKKIYQRPKRFRPLCEQTGRRCFQLRPHSQNLPKSSQTKWNCTGTGFSFSVLCNNAVLFCIFLALLFALFSHRFILHFYFPLFFSATKTQFFPATVTQVSDLPQPLFHCCPSQISELEWPPPKSVIVGIKQIKIDFYSSGRSDFTEIMAA